MTETVCRFAPSTTGPAHPGTLLAALLAWLDARQHHAHFILRLENLDPQRCRPEFAEEMIAALQWLGLDWDSIEYQDRQLERYAAAMDRLAESGRLYACSCTRQQIREHAQQAPDGSFRYPGTCRAQVVQQSDWRSCSEAIRLRLDDLHYEIHDESGLDLSQNPMQAMGDPVLRRRDGAFAYHLVAVVDDGERGVNRIIRGRDLIHSTAVQCALQDMLAYRRPVYRHHMLLLERHDQKLAKMHGSVGWQDISTHYTADAFIACLSKRLQLGCNDAVPCTPAALIKHFSWAACCAEDLLLHWREDALQWAVQ